MKDSGIKSIGPGNRYYEALDNDPQLYVTTRTWLPGWYRFECLILNDQPSGKAKLYFDYGSGYSESDCVSFELSQNRIVSRLVYLPFRARRVKLNPLNSPGEFSVSHCRFVWLTPNFARQRLYNRLASAHIVYRGLSEEHLQTQLQKDASIAGVDQNLWVMRRYLETFSYRTLGGNYTYWLKSLAKRHSDEVNVLQAQMELWALKPLISVLVPVHNTSTELLKQTVDSVKAQIYPYWELCIADDASSDQKTRHCLAEIERSDARIRVVWREQNGHISAASNSAVQIATGQYIALLDHDDLLTTDALLWVVDAINRTPTANLFYSDEDKLTADGERFAPHFKPDWNPDLLLSHNYVCHLGVYQTERLRRIGGFREGYEGSQDHDLVLRFTRDLDPSLIVHIPKVLYHWRAIEGSTAFSESEKSYTQQAGLSAIEDHLAAIGASASVEVGLVSNSYRVRWSLPDPKPLVSLLVPTRDRVDMLKPCIEALLERTDYRNFELLILDNQSSCPKTLSYMDEVVKRDARVRVLRWDHSFNYSAINNFGASYARGSILGLINNDIEPINTDWLDEMVSQVSRPEIGCVGAKLYYPDNSIQHAGVILGLGGVAGHSHKYFDRMDKGYFFRLVLVQNLSAVTAACLLVRKEVFDAVGGLNERDLKVAFNDVDLCLKVREAGYRNLWTPYAELYHHESVSRGADTTPQKRERAKAEVDYMRATWGQHLEADPAYNPNLSLDTEDFSLR